VVHNSDWITQDTERIVQHIFLFEPLKKIKPRKPNQANSRESITNPDIFHRPGGSGCTYLDDSVLEAPKSFKNDRVLRGVDENDEHKTHAKKNKMATDVRSLCTTVQLLF